MPHGFTHEVWGFAKEEALSVLRRKAVQNDPLITYSDIAKEIRAIKFEPDDKRLHELLGEISVDENAAGRGMLSVLVVHKHGEHKPGPGFFVLAKRLGRKTSDPEELFVAELAKVKDANAASSMSMLERHNLRGRNIEALPFRIPEYPGISHPISRGMPKFYRPESLKDTVEGKTDRTNVFEKIVVGLYLRLGRAVPYAFFTIDGEIRSLDAGCMKFLLNRPKPEIELLTDAAGEITAVRPLPILVSRYRLLHENLLSQLDGGSVDAQLPFDITAPPDERRKAMSKQTIREGATAFRASIMATWSRRCAVSGTAVDCVIHAAHIFRYLGPQTNSPYNGIALRADIHALFDAHLISIKYESSKLFTCVSRSILGTEYGKLGRLEITLPSIRSNRPHRELVEFHYKHFAEREQKNNGA
ncbi:HNH endonuclease [Bradyrhizobium sp. 170]|uniref:HNH endonuclease n=1 Tax=Bradyrhizobium sp. 170 TaxID=2782641 RepID=UPI001FFEAE5D|nr:HNH endonuclease [Bradyrhizobium sp. 170]UPK04558.1 HNH endonuclease [Bradyrhizobium sp. 170]